MSQGYSRCATSMTRPRLRYFDLDRMFAEVHDFLSFRGLLPA
jgi:hypothetical protein